MPGLGLVALGDSITNGGGNMARGVYPRSWAHWLALALGLPYTGLATDGATAPDVVADQLPRLRDGYDVGALFIGVNDVRSVEWDPGTFAAAHGRALQAIAQHSATTLALTIPLDLGRPRAGAKVATANAIVRRAAREHGALVVDLDDLRPYRALLPDAVHPHAVGQLEIADRAARTLGAPRLPSSGNEPDAGVVAGARWARGYALMWVRDVVRRVREGGLAGLQR
jgi:lysophospholipase L1-like esterase